MLIGGVDISNDFQVSHVGTGVVMSFFMAGNRGNESGGIDDEFSLGHGAFELLAALAGLVPEELALETQREGEGSPRSIRSGRREALARLYISTAPEIMHFTEPTLARTQ